MNVSLMISSTKGKSNKVAFMINQILLQKVKLILFLVSLMITSSKGGRVPLHVAILINQNLIWKVKLHCCNFDDKFFIR